MENPSLRYGQNLAAGPSCTTYWGAALHGNLADGLHVVMAFHINIPPAAQK